MSTKLLQSLLLHFLIGSGMVISLATTDGESKKNKTAITSDSLNEKESEQVAPVFTTVPVTSVDEGDDYVYSIETSNSDGNRVVVSGTDLPTWLSIDQIVEYEVSTLVGNGSAGSTDGSGTNFSFGRPHRMLEDSDGNLYVSDTQNHTIRKINPDGLVTTIAGTGTRGFSDGTALSAQLFSPGDLAMDGDGNIYFIDVDNSRIRKLDTDGNVTTIAGMNSRGSNDGTGTDASFFYPTGLTIGPDGNIYVADTGSHRIRKVTPEGVVTTFAGSTAFSFANGTGTQAAFNSPSGIDVDAAGNFYVTDHGNRIIRKITPEGVVSTHAGSGTAGYVDGSGSAVQFHSLSGIDVTPDGNVYVNDGFWNNIRRVDVEGNVTTVAGSGASSFIDGPAAQASFRGPNDVLVSASGALFVADGGNFAIRKLTALISYELSGNSTGQTGTQSISLTADDGIGGTAFQNFNIAINPVLTSDADVNFAENGTGVAYTATSTFPATFTLGNARDESFFSINSTTGELHFLSPPDYEVPVDGNGDNVYQVEVMIDDGTNQNEQIVEIIVTNLSDENPVFSSMAITEINEGDAYQYDVAVSDIDGDKVSVTASALPTWLSFNNDSEYEVSTLVGNGSAGSTDGSGTNFSFGRPHRMLEDSDGNLYVSDTQNHTIRKINPDGLVTTIAGTGTRGFSDGTALSAQLFSPGDLAMDGDGNIYFIDVDNSRIRKLDTDGNVTTIAGMNSRGSNDGTGTDASFFYPTGLTIGPDGNVYVADTGSHRIRKVTPEGVVTTFAGSTAFSFANGTGTQAAFNSPSGIDVDATGNFYVTDHGNRIIRKITPEGVVSTHAGSGTAGYVDGSGSAVQFHSLSGIDVTPDGNVYVNDGFWNNIRRVDTEGNVTTVAGSGASSFIDGPAAQASFRGPNDVLVSASGDLFVADGGNFAIRKIELLNDYSMVGDPKDHVGTHTISLTADDGTGGMATQAFEITVNPFITSASQVDFENEIGPEAYQATSYRSAVFSLGTSADEDMFSISSSGILNFSPSPDFEGFEPGDSYVVEIIATESGIEYTKTLTINITGDITEPVFISPVLTAFEENGTDMAYTILATDSNEIQYDLGSGNDEGLFSVTDEGLVTFSEVPDFENPKDGDLNNQYVIEVIANDGTNEVSQLVIIAVTNKDELPEFTSQPVLSVNDNEEYRYEITLSDQDGDQIHLTADNLPEWLSLDVAYKGIPIDIKGSGIRGAQDGASDQAQFNSPRDIARDAQGNLYIVERGNHSIRKIDTEGTVSTLAGNGMPGFTEGTGSMAQFNHPQGVATDADGNIYVADSDNHRIRKISPSGVVTTLAGSGIAGYQDGAAGVARFRHPFGVYVDANGNCFVADSFNSTIRKVDPDGNVTTVAGNGTAGYLDGTGTNARFSGINRLAGDSNGNLYIVDTGNHRIRKVSAEGVVTTLAGNGTAGFADGAGTNARFNGPSGIAHHVSGSLYISDEGNNRIRVISPSGEVSTLMGDGIAGFADGAGTSARFNIPKGIHLIADDLLAIADDENNRIRLIQTHTYLLQGNAAGQSGEETIILTGNDGKGGISNQEFNIAINDVTAPVFITSTPADGATEFGGNSLSFTFNENVQKGAGRIAVIDASDDTEINGAGVASSRVSIQGKTVTLDLVNALPFDKEVYVRIPNGAFLDMAGLPFEGILNKTELNFSSVSTPKLISSNPVDDATDFNGTTITFTFDRNILKGTGRISVLDAVDNSELSGAGMGSPRLTVSDNKLTFDLINPLPLDKQVYVRIPPSAIKDENGHFFSGLLDNSTLNFTSVSSPELVSSTPSDEAVDFNGTLLSFTFDRNILKGTGRISVRDAADNSEFSGAGVGGPRVTVTGNTLTFDLINPLPLDREFYVRIPASAIKDVNDVFFEGILDNTTLNFASPTTPKLTSSNPADETVEFTGSSIELTFDRNVIKGTGRISIKDASDNSEVAGAGVGNSRVTIAGNVVTIDLINPLPRNKQVYLTIPASAFKDVDNQFYAGIQNNTTLNFSTETSPQLISSTPQNGDTDFTATTLTLTFDRNIVKGTGRISIRDVATKSEVRGVGVGSTRVSITDNVVTVDLISSLPLDREVYLRIPASAFKDANDVFYAGILDNTTLNFSTPTTPQLVSSNPADGATDFSGTVLTFTFDKNMIKGTGRISVFNVADDTEITGAGVGSTRVNVTGNVMTFDLVNAIPAGTSAYVRIPASALKDANDIFYQGILDNTTLNFSRASGGAEVNPSNFAEIRKRTGFDFSVSLYPNPVESLLTIDLSQIGEEPSVRISGTDGVLRFNKENVKTPKLELDVSEYAQGVYIVAAQSQSGQTIYKKFVVRR